MIRKTDDRKIVIVPIASRDILAGEMEEGELVARDVYDEHQT